MTAAMKLTLALCLIFEQGCTTLGPPAHVIAYENEMRRQRVGKIFVAPTLGTGVQVSDDEVNKAVPQSAYERYGDNLLLPPRIAVTATSLGMPERVAPLLPLGWQVAFFRWVTAGKRGKDDLVLAPPVTGKRPVASDKDFEKLGRKLASREKVIRAVRKAQSGDDLESLDKSLTRHLKTMTGVNAIFSHLAARLGITHVLVSYLENGSEGSFDANKTLTLHLAVVERETGKIRAYGFNKGRGHELGATYPEFVGMMAENIFLALDKVEPKD